MRLYAHTLAGVWREWEGVVAWRLDGPMLRIAYRNSGETVALPPEVMGLRDTSPVRHVSDTRTGADRPVPPEARIPSREAPRARFGDSPRRRQFKGDGS